MERLNIRDNSNLSKTLFSLTMVVILLRRYIIFNLEPTAFIREKLIIIVLWFYRTFDDSVFIDKKA